MLRNNGVSCTRTIPRKETEVKSGPETGTGSHGSTRTRKPWFAYWSLDCSDHRGCGERRFGIADSPSQMPRFLHELGFSLQYPRQEYSKADKKRQATWLEGELPDIKKSPGRWRDPDVSRGRKLQAGRIDFLPLGFERNQLRSEVSARKEILESDGCRNDW